MNDFVAKPIDSAELLRKIAAHCRTELDEAMLDAVHPVAPAAEAAALSGDQTDALESLLNSLEPLTGFGSDLGAAPPRKQAAS